MLATPWSCDTPPVVPLWQRATSPLISLPAPQTRRQRCWAAWYCRLAGKTLPARKTTWRGINRHQHHVRQAVQASCFAKMAGRALWRWVLATARCASCWHRSSSGVGAPQLRQNYITPHCIQWPPVSRRLLLWRPPLARPAGESNRRYAKLPTLKRARQPPALPSRFASYVQSAVALVVCWRCGIGQALRASFWSAASPVMWCWPPPTPGLALLRSFARAVCPSAPRGGSLRTAPGVTPPSAAACWRGCWAWFGWLIRYLNSSCLRTFYKG